MNKNKTNRRKFFTTAGKRTLGAVIFSSLPFKIFSKTPNKYNLKKVSINKDAVKRSIKN